MSGTAQPSSEAAVSHEAHHGAPGAGELDAQARPPHEALSDREYQVLRMIAAGKTVKDIAGELSLSIKTVSTYRSRIMEKMKMKTNAEVMHYVIRHQLLD